jgi:ribosomal protein L7Ae-like RNA K-turn-binding protein
MGRGGYSDKILTKIVEKYIPVLNVKNMDLLGVLMNIKEPLSKVNFKLFR